MNRKLFAFALLASSGCTALDLWDAPVVVLERRSCRSDADCANVSFDVADRYQGASCVEITPRCGLSDAICTVDVTARDSDDDGYRDQACATEVHELPPFEVDCKDDDPAAFPDADLDRDGYPVDGCAAPGVDTDCDDTHFTVKPGAVEACDGRVSDCNAPDGGDRREAEDPDGDGHAPPGITTCEDVFFTNGLFASYPKDDCAEAVVGATDAERATLRRVFPSAPDVCDGIVNDCSNGTGADPAEDQDGDRFASPESTACDTTLPGSFPATDCDDADGDTYPGAPESCDSIINDCLLRTSPDISRRVEDPDRDLHYAGNAPCIDPIRNIECDAAASDPTLQQCPPRREVPVVSNLASPQAWGIADVDLDGVANAVYSGGSALYAPNLSFTAGAFSDVAATQVRRVVLDPVKGDATFEMFIARAGIPAQGTQPSLELRRTVPAGAPLVPVAGLIPVTSPVVSATADYGELAVPARTPAIVYQSNGTGGRNLVWLAPGAPVATEIDPTAGNLDAVRIVDVDGDRTPDVVAVPTGSTTLRVYRGNPGTGGFDAPTTVTLPSGIGAARDFAFGDLEGVDGDVDFFVRTAFGTALMAQTAPGVFTDMALGVVAVGGSLMPLGTRLTASGIGAADLDGAGGVEMIYAYGLSDEVVYLDQIGSNLFAQHSIVTDLDGAETVAAGDADGDLDLDILAAGDNANYIAYFESTFVSNLAFTVHNIDRAFNSLERTEVVDADGDGWNDVLAGSTSDGLRLWRSLAADASSFAESPVLAPNASPSDFAVGDLDGDTVVDVAYVTSNGAVALRIGAGDGSFGSEIVVDSAANARAITVGEVDAASRGAEIVVTSDAPVGPSVVYYTRNGNAFASNVVEPGTARCPDVAVVDYDADGDADIVSACGASGLRLHRDVGTTFQREILIDGTGADYYGVVVVDLDRDGDPDMIASNVADSDPVLVINQGASVALVSLPVPFSAAGVPVSREGVAAADFDRDGDVDIAVGGGVDVFVFQSIDESAHRYASVLVATNRLNSVSVDAADLDTDGIPDLIAAVRDDNDLVWWSTGGKPWWNH